MTGEMMPENYEPEVTLESIDSALDELIKATEATAFVKGFGGVAVDQGGHVDERGATRGGYADTADVGSLDSMMIGRMEQSLVEQGFPAAAISAFMRGMDMQAKQDDEDDDEDDDEQEPNEAPPSGKMGKPASTSGGVGTNPRVRASAGSSMGKSIDAFAGDPAIANAIDVSPYLEALVQRTCEQLDSFGKSMGAQGDKQDEVNTAMAAAVYGIGQLMKSVDAHARRLDERLGLVERQPNAPRGVRSERRARAIAKSFGGASPAAEGGQGQLNKSQVLATLSYLNLEKGVKQIGGRDTSELIYLFEGGGQLAPQALGAVQRFLATNPSEAAAALSYC